VRFVCYMPAGRYNSPEQEITQLINCSLCGYFFLTVCSAVPALVDRVCVVAGAMTSDHLMFQNREDAAARLAEAQQLKRYKDDPNAVVIGLPRGGIPMAQIIANKLNLTMDLVVPRKIGHPSHPEFALGALTEFGEVYWNPEFESHPSQYGITPQSATVQRVVEAERSEAERRKRVFRGHMPGLQLEGKTVIIVDDGIATGATMKAAIISLRRLGAKRIVVAVPVGSPRTVKELQSLADEVVCLAQPYYFQAVGQFYHHFDQTEDSEVIQIMREEAAKQRAPQRAQPSQPQSASTHAAEQPAVAATARAEKGSSEKSAADGEKERRDFSSGALV